MNLEDTIIPLTDEEKKKIIHDFLLSKPANMRDDWLRVYTDKNGRKIIEYKNKTIREI